MIEFLLAVDGGGSGTRAIVARRDGRILARAEAGPSALSQGVSAAWEQVRYAIAAGFAQAGLDRPEWPKCALAAGLSGVHNEFQREAFRALLPAFARIVLVTDGYTTLFGAHAGNPGLIVASGTGSVGEVLHADGRHDVVGGWGFPVGDEGSGAWLGLNAMRIAQSALDGRATSGALARAIFGRCGMSRQALAAWMASAGQFDYAQLAPEVFGFEDVDLAASDLLAQSCHHLEAMVVALDPQQTLPVAICGSIGQRLQGRLATAVRRRCVPAAMGPTEGALLLLRTALEKKQ